MTIKSIAKQDFMVAKQPWSLVGFGKSKNFQHGCPRSLKILIDMRICVVRFLFLVSYKPSFTTVTKV